MVPSPTDLTYFLEVANLLNLSRAAECLGVSQPSLTFAMRRLEESVGTPILIRHKRGVSLTKAGKQLLIHTRQLLQHWDNIRSETLASMHEIQGCFTIGCHQSLGLLTLPRFLAKLLEKHPRLEIKLQHDLSRKITEQVITFKIDIGLSVNPVRHPDLVIKHLYHDKVKLWSHTKSQNPQPGMQVLLCDPDLIQTQSLLRKLKKQGIHYSRILTSNNLELLADLAHSGCGVAILPENIASTRNLVALPKTPSHEDEICVVYHGENRNVVAIQTIANAIIAACKKS